MFTDRRIFLGRLVLGITGLISAALAGVAGGYLFGGLHRPRGRRWTRVVRLARLEPGQPLHAEYLEVVPDAWATIRRRKSVWLVRRDTATITAFDPHCTHLGCPYNWDPAERLFKCPCHGGVFDIEGRVIAGPPPRPLDRVAVRTTKDQLFLGGVIRSRPA